MESDILQRLDNGKCNHISFFVYKSSVNTLHRCLYPTFCLRFINPAQIPFVAWIIAWITVYITLLITYFFYSSVWRYRDGPLHLDPRTTAVDISRDLHKVQQVQTLIQSWPPKKTWMVKNRICKPVA